jgi:hypothetical protein
MAKLTCSKSGVIFQCEHMPLATYNEHPLFAVPQKRLISLAGQWAAQRLTPTESYLLYLALLDSTDLVVWRTPAHYMGAQTDAIVAGEMESLLHIIAKINVINHPSFTLPSFAVGAETASLENSRHWIQVWTDNYREWYTDYLDAGKREELKEVLDHREEALQRLIKSSTPVEAYANTLAEWASIAGAFPATTTPHPVTGMPTPLGEYWKQLIRTIANEDKMWRYPRADLVELIEHCEGAIVHGNIYAHTLMKYLRSGLRKYDDYLGFGDISIGSSGGTPFTVMSPALSGIHAINRAALLNTAPEEEPKKHQYPTTLAWLKAYTKWKLANQHRSPKAS